jgi:hypothetical protein
VYAGRDEPIWDVIYIYIRGNVIMKLTVLNKKRQKYLFFSKMKDKQVKWYCLGIGTNWTGEDIRKG